jgi:hypothetical protein
MLTGKCSLHSVELQQQSIWNCSIPRTVTSFSVQVFIFAGVQTLVALHPAVLAMGWCRPFFAMVRDRRQFLVPFAASFMQSFGGPV